MGQEYFSYSVPFPTKLLHLYIYPAELLFLELFLPCRIARLVPHHTSLEMMLRKEVVTKEMLNILFLNSHVWHLGFKYGSIRLKHVGMLKLSLETFLVFQRS